MPGPDETRDGVALTNLGQPLFDGAGATKRDLVDYLDAVHDRLVLRRLEIEPLGRKCRGSGPGDRCVHGGVRRLRRSGEPDQSPAMGASSDA